MATKKIELERAALSEGCLGKSADDEPVFILVARDQTASEHVRAWADRVEYLAVANGEMTLERRHKIADARLLADDMDAWRREHGGKLPD